MQLNKFGAILAFAIDLEENASGFYREAAAAYPSQEHEEHAAAARKRLSRLQTMRRELVNEMLLEPIDAFEQPALIAPRVDSMSAEGVQEQKVRIEQARKEFYTLASAKLATVAPAVSRAFRKMAEET